jgi:hypothetical protein
MARYIHCLFTMQLFDLLPRSLGKFFWKVMTNLNGSQRLMLLGEKYLVVF